MAHYKKQKNRIKKKNFCSKYFYNWKNDEGYFKNTFMKPLNFIMYLFMLFF